MKRRCSTLILLIISGYFRIASAQTSLNEKNGFWENTSTWSGGVMPGTISSGTINVSFGNVIIAGTVKTQNNLSLTTISSLTINAGDTLVVLGNLSLSASNLTVNGILVVLGNLSNSFSNVNVGGSGKLVTTGNYTNFFSSYSFTGPTYAYGSGPAEAQNETALATNDPPLYDYVNYIYGVLPVELISFVAKSSEDGVNLSWQTASEYNNAYFLLENSVDGVKFKTIATVPGHGNSKSLQEYSFAHIDALIGRSYYRLSQVDLSGETSVYEIIKVDHDGDDLIRIFPNPATDCLHINVNLSLVSIIIHNVQGIPQSAFLSNVEDDFIDVSGLERGVYYIKLIDKNDHHARSLRFIKE